MKSGGRKVLIAVIAAVWLGYSAAVLGWVAWTSTPAEVCVTR
jgi:hypothetical protein